MSLYWDVLSYAVHCKIVTVLHTTRRQATERKQSMVKQDRHVNSDLDKAVSLTLQGECVNCDKRQTVCSHRKHFVHRTYLVGTSLQRMP